LIFEWCRDANPEQRPNFNFDEVVYKFREESFPEALEVDIRASKHYQTKIAPTQVKTSAQLGEKGKVVRAPLFVQTAE
jgi:hypothetical protein